MPIGIIFAYATKVFPSQYYVQIALAILAIAVVRAWSQGRVTNRERDLHARVVLLTGAFTPIGLTLMEKLALRGAHIIALAPDPIDAPQISLVVEALSATTGNDRVHADHCDLTSPASVRAFCTRFLTGQEHRLDAIIFTHEYQHTGAWLVPSNQKDEETRTAASLSTFLITTLLLPTLLVAPPERDIRIINVVNPLYAAAVPTFSPSSTPRDSSPFLREGYRALKTAIFTRHLQRVLDALPSAPAPNPDSASPPLAGSTEQKSNIVAVSVSPGFSRNDTIAPLLGVSRTRAGLSFWGLVIYIILQPLLRIFTKSPYYAVQSVLHALFLPTPFKRDMPPTAGRRAAQADEILRPGALYSDCSVVRLRFPPRVTAPAADAGAEKFEKPQVPPLDDEMGGEELGALVWESYESGLKAWEKKYPPETAESTHTSPPTASSSN